MDDLIKRAQKKDADAFTKLMQSQMQNMYKTAWAILHNDEDVADAISETILVCFEKLDQLRQTQFFKTWMTRILINQCNDILKQHKKIIPVEEIRENTSPLQEYENIEWMETLKSLDEKYRLVIILYYVNGLTTTEIGTVLHMPVSTVRTRLSRGRNQMASLYNMETGRERSL